MLKTISISILDLNLLYIKEYFEVFKKNNIKNIHLDLIDTSFTNNISFGPKIINDILEKYFDVFDFSLHVMVISLDILKEINCSKFKFITVGKNQFINLKKFNFVNVNIGIYINPDDLFDNNFIQMGVQHVIIMLVNPGKGKQNIIYKALDNINLVKRLNNDVLIMVDGGINFDNIKFIKNVNYIIIGSSITNISLNNLNYEFKKISK